MIDRKAFHSFSYGLYIISSVGGEASAGGRAVGCVVNTLQQVTSSPFRVSVAINKDNHTAQVIQRAGKFAATIIAQSAAMELIGTFGFMSSKDVDKFADFAVTFDEQGTPFVSEQMVARFSVKVIETIDVGTHMLFVGDVVEAKVLSDEPPITYDYYRAVKGGKTPPKASSYVGDETVGEAVSGTSAADADGSPTPTPPAPKGQTAWLCKVCGHVEIAKTLPEGFKCPICGQPKEVFEKIVL
jgi:flavin reductase (DIM6/NTAB) family NADH-FMN oxidoreductase RutF/rubredoxin